MSHSDSSQSLHFISWGAVGIVFFVSNRVVLKHARTSANRRIKREHHVFDLLEEKCWCPNIVRSFLRLPDINFLENMTGGNLEARLRARQVRDAHKFLSVRSLEPTHLVSRWIVELARAAAWLESLGLAHGDIRPSNLLLDSADHLKLADFDCSAEVGQQELEAGAPPYARVQGPEAGEQRGTFGLLGPRTEQFAIGSVFYFLTRGFEPYEDTLFTGPEIVDLLQNKQFPLTETNDTRDDVIKKCWHGDFVSIQQLAIEVEPLGSIGSYYSKEDSFYEIRQECIDWYNTWKPSVNAWVTLFRAQVPGDEG